MKSKEIVELVVAVLILAIAGYVVYKIVVPSSPSSSGASHTVTYVQVTPVDPNFDSNSLNELGDSSKVRDFYSPPDLSSGLNNSQPFGPLQ
ncbi:MAG TPA: hypothetical protein VMR75_01020 [Candidatus Saccharimonadales bacterium]|nr:hypothetical protein [Candidatus Saccharimonadales bacterium]